MAIQPNLDFPTSIFEEIESEVLVQEYPDMNFAELVPINAVDENIESLGNFAVDFTGKAKPVSGKPGEALPVIGFTASKDTSKVFDFGFALEVSQADIRSALHNRSVDAIQTKLLAARFAYQKSLYDMAISGNDDLGVTGLVNAAGIQTSAVVGGKWNAAAKTAEQIRDDLMRCYNAVLTQTLNARPANIVLMPLSAFTIANSVYLANTTITPIQAFRNGVRDSGGSEVTIRTSNAAGSDLLMYNYDPLVLRMNMAKELTYLPEQPSSLGYSVPAFYRFSGVQIRNTHAFNKMGGIL